MQTQLEKDNRTIKILKWTVAIVAIGELIIGIAGNLLGTHLYFFALSLVCVGALVFTIVHGVPMVGKRNTVIIFVIGMAVSLLFESLGANFGILFSKYTYTDYIPGPKLFGFNVFSMVAYGMYCYQAWILAQAAVGMYGGRFRSKLDVIVTAVVGGLLFVSIDFATDPFLASITGAYDWEQPGVYYGVPYQNYLGWIVMAIVMMLCVSLVLYVSQVKDQLPPVPTVSKRRWFWEAPALLYMTLFIQTPFYALISENTEITVYSGQSFMTHDIYWGVMLVYMGAILVPSLIIWYRTQTAPELEK